jgi:ATP-dependent DNA helicase Rep
MKLNTEQAAAIQELKSPLLVLAGAGTGKTRVITQKIVALIQEENLLPREIVALTFTNKAAREMAARIQKALPHGKAKGLQLSTFHTFGLNFLKKEGHKLGLRRGFSIFDEQDSYGLLKDLVLSEENLNEQILRNIQQQLSLWKNELVSPRSALLVAKDEQEATAAKVYERYVQQLESYNAVDFDDLIVKPSLALKQDPELLIQWQSRIKYILVDEYQDTNACQYELLKLLVGQRARFTVVGDDDQSVYAWRGARPENILQLQQDFTDLKVIKLEQNYRSTNNILVAANHLIRQNPHVFEKALWSEHGSGDRIKIFSAQDDQDEAERVVNEILAHKFRARGSFSDYAILYRSNHQSRIFEQSLRAYSVPYTVSGGQSFFARVEVKDLCAYLRLLVNPEDDAAFLRAINTPKREIGTQTLEKLGRYAQQRGMSLFYSIFELGLEQTLNGDPLLRLRGFADWLTLTADNVKRGDPIAVLKDFFTEVAYESWLQESNASKASIDKRIQIINDFKEWFFALLTPKTGEELSDGLSLEAALQKMMLLDILDRQEDKKRTEAVQLLTLHAAKGLEFPNVFLVGLEEGILPHQNSMDSDANAIEEERRLCYVGMTRAMRSLTLSYAKQRRKYGETLSSIPSRFLDELPEECLEREDAPSTKDPVETKKQGIAQLASLSALLKG